VGETGVSRNDQLAYWTAEIPGAGPTHNEIPDCGTNLCVAAMHDSCLWQGAMCQARRHTKTCDELASSVTRYQIDVPP
jgi:hypothetical protein